MYLLCHCNASNGLYCQAASPEKGGVYDVLDIWISQTKGNMRPDDVPVITDIRNAPRNGLWLINRKDVIRASLRGCDMALSILEELTDAD